MNSTVFARAWVHLRFPSSTQRLAYIGTKQQEKHVAWQASDDTFWQLIKAPNEWKQLTPQELHNAY